MFPLSLCKMLSAINMIGSLKRWEGEGDNGESWTMKRKVYIEAPALDAFVKDLANKRLNDEVCGETADKKYQGERGVFERHHLQELIR